jgi:hypothetical protein
MTREVPRLNPRAQALTDFLTEAKPSKYRNRKVEIGGITFASQKEGRRYQHLKALQGSGHIRDLKLQQTFPLKVNGVLVCKYQADFTYTTCDVKPGHEVMVVEDVKSPITRKNRAYRIKFKLFAACNGFEITEV